MTFASVYRAAIGAPAVTSSSARPREDQGQRGDPSWGNAAGVCEATFEALRIKALQPGPSPRIVEVPTPFGSDMAISGQRLAELYTQRFGGTYKVIGMDGRAGDDGRVTLLVEIERKK